MASYDDRRTCWVCFGCDEDDPSAKWNRPCRCRGTTKWVHEICLQRWFDEKQHGNPTVRVFCPQCNTEYMVSYPPLSAVLVLIEFGEKMVNKICPIAAAGVVVGSLYWSAVTFGAISVMQVMGHKRGFEVMEKADPLFLLVGLPVIPMGLLLAKMIRWEDFLLKMWRRYSQHWWIMKMLFGGCEVKDVSMRESQDNTSQMDLNNSTRILCGALALPTFATACGNYFFSKVDSPLKRAVLGGSVFILVKGLVKMFYKQQQFTRMVKRHIRDFIEPTSL